MNKKKYILLGILLLIIICIILVLYNNKNIKVTNIEYINENIPNSFNNFSMLQISDLHNEEFGNNQEGLINKVKDINPDIVVITGDLIDSKKYDLNVALDFIKGIKEIPIYFVSGNHESWSNKYDEIKETLIKENVIVLDNEIDIIKVDDQSIEIVGISDSNFQNELNFNFEDILKDLSNDENFQILLSHRPEYFEEYVKNNYDLVLSGHAHGGQVNIPFIGGLIAPDQGLFPEYDSGLFKEDNTTMYVSRGLGNSVIPIRINNNPEIVNLILKNS